MADGRRPPDAALLVFCALGVERWALRDGLRAATRRAAPAPAGDPPPAPVRVVRSGMGPRAAERAVRRALATAAATAATAGGAGPPDPPGPAVAAAGFCAGLVPGMRPGDVVVAEETRAPGGRTRCPDAARLAEVLAARLDGRGTVHLGPLAGSDRVVRGGARRAALHRGGAVAVDMESAVTLLTAGHAGGRPVAAVRVVVDAPGYELLRFGTLRSGISAFRALRSVIPAVQEWRYSQQLPRR